MKLIGRKILIPIFIQSNTRGGGSNVLKKKAKRRDDGIKTKTMPIDMKMAYISALPIIFKIVIISFSSFIFAKTSLAKNLSAFAIF